MNKRPLLAASLAALVFACNEPSQPDYGDLEITTTAPTIEQGFTTADGWTIKYDRFLVSLTSLEVAGATDLVLTASTTTTIFDQVQTSFPPDSPDRKVLLFSENRTARPWEDVHFSIGPAVPDDVEAELSTTVLGNVAQADVTAMETEGLSLLVSATATKGAEVKKLEWRFTTDTLYGNCSSTENGQVVPGVTVPVGGLGSANIVMRGDVLFADDLTNPASAHFDAIAAADADANGVVTLDELAAVDLGALRTSSGLPYATGESTATDLRGFTEALSQHLVAGFRDNGTCTAEPVVAAE